MSKLSLNDINILIIVDAMGAVSSGNLSDNVYLVDTNKYIGSYREGETELVTKCKDRQRIIWRVVSIDPNTDANIVGFSGQMTGENICVPQKDSIMDCWIGTVETQGGTGTYQYTATLSFDGHSMTFDPYIDVSA